MEDMRGVKAMLADINRAIADDDVSLNTGQMRFLESVRWKLDHQVALSDSQDQMLESLWKKATNQE